MSAPDKIIPVKTADGSPTLSSERFQATYHSIHGALDESVHVFIIAGLYDQICLGHKHISILEMGFGTGLNAMLTAIAAKQFEISVDYHTVELYPLTDHETIDSLRFEFKSTVENLESLSKLHSLEWNKMHSINEHFSFTKYHADITDFSINKKFNSIYFDAFAPKAQSHLWEKELHLTLKELLKKQGTLVTYCAQGAFKRMLKEIGYQLEPLNGPGRKHEMTRARN